MNFQLNQLDLSNKQHEFTILTLGTFNGIKITEKILSKIVTAFNERQAKGFEPSIQANHGRVDGSLEAAYGWVKSARLSEDKKSVIVSVEFNENGIELIKDKILTQSCPLKLNPCTDIQSVQVQMGLWRKWKGLSGTSRMIQMYHWPNHSLRWYALKAPRSRKGMLRSLAKYIAWPISFEFSALRSSNPHSLRWYKTKPNSLSGEE